MRKDLKRRSSAALWLGGGAALLAIVFYNFWAYCCGRCTLRNFFTVGFPGALLLLANLGALVVLAALKLRRRKQLAERRCSCGGILADTWLFCTRCGAGRSAGENAL